MRYRPHCIHSDLGDGDRYIRYCCLCGEQEKVITEDVTRQHGPHLRGPPLLVTRRSLDTGGCSGFRAQDPAE